MQHDDYLAIIREHTTSAEYDALLLRYNGHHDVEAAYMLGISRRTYRDRVKRGLARLHKHATKPPLLEESS